MSCNHVNCITINTDASLNTEHKIGGYAFYIICDNFRLKVAGPFKEKVESPVKAEMMCMANAFQHLLNYRELPTTNLIVINSDALHAFGYIGKNSSDKVAKQVYSILRKLKKKTGVDGKLAKHEFRHVKAHNGIPDARSYINEWCDHYAKQAMKKNVEQWLKNENSK